MDANKCIDELLKQLDEERRHVRRSPPSAEHGAHGRDAATEKPPGVHGALQIPRSSQTTRHQEGFVLNSVQFTECGQ
ncbi:hypothetical protein EYF80_039050 [Liparis tanakae]|uniref:Uncharacterized protein n=1 Tax=Liparis tanakae TaxID=230148 RepID=A0A4Z2GBI6_9TELE|nr:hypothetical protein EYF80_039050 [Liparis tanakae]